MILLFALPALAAEGAPAGCNVVPFAGSVGSLVSAEALTSFGRTYSAAATLEERIFPVLYDPAAEGDRVEALYIGYDGLYDIAPVPGSFADQRISGGSEPCPTGVGIGMFDVSTYNFAIGARFGYFSAWYAANNTSGWEVSNGIDRTGQQLVSFTFGHAFAALAPLLGSKELRAGEMSSMSFDWMGGVGVDVGYAAASVGYVGSEGLILDVRQPQTRLFAETILDVGQDDEGGASAEDALRYLRSGARAVRLLRSIPEAGASDLLVSSYRITTTGAVDGEASAAAAEATEAEQSSYDFRAGTLNQRDLWGLADVGATYAWKPSPQVYEWHLGLHSRGYHADTGDPPAKAAAGVFVGTVDLPEQRWFGHEGGRSLYTNVEARFSTREYGAGGSYHFRVTRNDPSTLAIFPYAQDSWSAHLSAHLAFQ